MSICVTSWFLHCPSLGPPTPDRLLGAILTIQFLFLRFYLFIFRQRGGREKEKERNINVWLPLTRPLWGPRLQPRHVPWLGTEPATLVCRPALNPLSHTSQGSQPRFTMGKWLQQASRSIYRWWKYTWKVFNVTSYEGNTNYKHSEMSFP